MSIFSKLLLQHGIMVLTSKIDTVLIQNTNIKSTYTAGKLFNVNNGNTTTMCEISSKLTIKTPEQCKRRRIYFHLCGVVTRLVSLDFLPSKDFFTGVNLKSSISFFS